VILTHYDIVWPVGTAALRPLQIDGDIASGPGVYDMRGGIVAALGALRALRALDALNRPVVLLATADEETGSITSEPAIRELGETAHAVLIPEPPLASGGIKTARKGVLTYRVDVEGRAAHAGLAPESGVSAIRVLLEAALAMYGLARPEAGTTVNVGVIAGGVSANVMAPSAFAEIDVRVETMLEFERIESQFKSIGGERDGARIAVARLAARPPMERTPAIAAVAEEAKQLGALVGLELDEGSAGGASDGNFVAPLGVSVVDGLGPVGGGAHALDEHIRLTSLVERVALISLLIALL
jgi:glutamate carboxypeptidase